ncbi:MAG: SUMF1/EgtB/PvdO family nonheme iron enzyme [Treponema sp.]|jgi:hypothetical protein|nr:SUMF1/EgtB/PvdO family nonheme iron enzyme [Treponema sp.]
MFTRKKEVPAALPEDTVHLPVLLGIRPQVYLAALYALILLIVLFFLLLYPGISKPGSVLVLRSEPLGAAVRVAGVYQGTTPCEVFVPPGTYPVVMTLPGFSDYARDLEIQGRLLGSLFFPRKEPLTGILEETAPGAALRAGAREYAAWSFAGEPTPTYQIPQSLAEGAYRSGPGAGNPERYETLDRLLHGATRFAATKAGLRDLIRAKYTVDNAGLSPSPVSSLRSIEDLVTYLSETPGSAIWLGTVLPPEAQRILTVHPWYTKQAQRAASLKTGSRSQGLILGRTFRVDALFSMGFKEIAPGTLVHGDMFPQETALEGFSIAETEASAASWEAFLEAHPDWKGEHTPRLMEQGLVTEDYLVALDQSVSGDRASASIPGVSWYAARAYCQWLTDLLPPTWAAYEVRLPTEAEWEYAAWAALDEAEPDEGLRDMIGGLWEWCGDPYAPFPFLSPDQETLEEIGAPERTVRGGSWVNPPGSVNPGTRASLPPASCSPFVSFRPVLALKAPGQGEVFHE